MLSDLSLAPLRSIDDFLLSSARFQLPSLSAADRWHHRVAANLLYYQTNYFAVAVLLFVLFSLANPQRILIGFVILSFAVGASFLAARSLSKNWLRSPTAHRRLKRSNSRQTSGDRSKYLSLLVVVGCGYLILYHLASVATLLGTVLAPIVLTLAHASLRLRNLKNKISNKIETVGLKKTPMGVILGLFDFDQRLDGDPLN